MELIGQNDFPAVTKRRFRKFLAEQCFFHFSEQLRIHIKKLTLTVVSLVFCDRGVSTSVIFQIKLAVPFRYERIIFHFFIQSAQEFVRGAEFCIGKSGDTVAQTVDIFDMLCCRAAAAVTVAVRQHDFIGETLLLRTVPGSRNHFGIYSAVISRTARGRFVLVFILCRQEVRFDL